MWNLRWLILATITTGLLCASLLTMNIISKKETEKNENNITEFVGFHYAAPHPYKLKTVYMYRFVATIGEFLVRLDENQEIIPGLAEDWEISTDRRKITFKIRKGEFSAYDVEESLKRLVAFGQTAHSNLSRQASVNKIKALNNDYIEIETLNDAGSIIRPLLMADTAIIPDRYWIKDSSGNEFVDWLNYKGRYLRKSGGFKSQGFDSLKFEPNQNHYAYEEGDPSWVIKWLDFNVIAESSKIKQIFSDENAFLSLAGTETIKLHKYLRGKVPFYETKPNGVHILLPNRNSDIFKDKRNRQYLLKKVFNSKIPLNNPQNRAFQIPQPGLVGHLNSESFNSVRYDIERFMDVSLSTPLVVRVPDHLMFNTEWVEKLMEQIGVPFKIKVIKSHDDFKKAWDKGEVDLQLVSVGMSDIDPISGASFLFSKTGLNADNENQDVLNILNDAKSYSDTRIVNKKLKEAFKFALREALAIPLYYTNNIHYHSQSINLNINDVYSESVFVDRVEIKE